MKKTNEYPYLEFNKDIHSDKQPVIKGTRVTVEDILNYIAVGWDIKRVSDELELDEDAIKDALRFASNVLLTIPGKSNIQKY